MLRRDLLIKFVLLMLVPMTQFAEAFCEVMISHYEKQHNIPEKLLQAVALAESGRTMPGKGRVAWPWTINAEGTPYVFDTKEEAIDKVRELQRTGVRSIDVGCMQINLKHHPNAFSSLEEAFDPKSNIAYAAEFLKQKMQDQGNWHNAVAHYHSASPVHNIPYKNRVFQIWDRVRDMSANMDANLVTPQALQTLSSPVRRTVFAPGNNGRIAPLRVRYSPYGGRAHSALTAAPGQIQVIRPINTAKFIPIKQKGAIGQLRKITPAVATAPSELKQISHSVYGQRKFFKLKP